jgi:hypothetical protein
MASLQEAAVAVRTKQGTANRPSWASMVLASVLGVTLAYQSEAPAQESAASLPASQQTSQSLPTSQPAALMPLISPVFPLGDSILAPTPSALSEISDAEILQAPRTNERSWNWKEQRYRLNVYQQTGRGFQSVAKDGSGPGSEDALIVQPMLYFQVEQGKGLRHDIYIPLDVVSAASVDALDAISTASAVNEAGSIDVTTSYQADPKTQMSLRYGIHLEEPFRSWFAGAAYSRSLADDNANISVSGNATFDLFDYVTILGGFRGITTRVALNANVAFSQILSPTTLFDVNYGFTLQNGTLQTTYNSVFFDDGQTRGEELFPEQRQRHAVAARLSQHIPWTRSTLKASYRYYVDDFGLSANTATAELYQYLVPWCYVRGSYRYYDQTGVDFFQESFPVDLLRGASRTSDSDLAPFDSSEVAVKLVLLGERSPFASLQKAFFDAEFSQYVRSNNLEVQMFSLAYGRSF